LFVIPEERTPPAELLACARHVAEAEPLPDFIDAVVDPRANALACCAARAHPRLPGGTSQEREALCSTALEDGPDALNNAQRLLLLNDPLLMSRLHFEVWASPKAHAGWRARTLAG